jgi:HlyD family secretion protein
MASPLRYVGCVVLGGALGGGAGYFGPQLVRERAAPTAQAADTAAELDKVTALGTIQPEGRVIDVALPAGLRPVRFNPRLIKDSRPIQGQVAERGEWLAELDGYDERTREIELIAAEIDEARKGREAENQNERATLDELDLEQDRAIRLGKLEGEELDMKVKAAAGKHDLARRQLGEVEGLQVNNTIARQQYEQLKTQAELSLEELKAADAERARVKTQLEINTSAPKIEEQKRKVRVAAERARAQFPVETLERKRALAEATRQRSAVLAPTQGEILEVTTAEGDAGVGKPLLRLGDTRRMWVLAELYEDDRRNVAEGLAATINGRGLPRELDGSLKGTVASISPILTARQQTPLDPTARAGERVFEAWIKLDLDPGRDRTAIAELRKRILLPVDVTIDRRSTPRPAGLAGRGRSAL